MHHNMLYHLKINYFLIKIILKCYYKKKIYSLSNSFISSTKGLKNELKSLGEVGPGIKKGINKFSFLTRIEGSRLLLIKRNA